MDRNTEGAANRHIGKLYQTAGRLPTCTNTNHKIPFLTRTGTRFTRTLTPARQIAEKLGCSEVQMNAKECVLTKLSRSLDTVCRWFTHATERGPSFDTEPEETQNVDIGRLEKIKIRGPLDSHFGEKKLQSERPSKRDRNGRAGISHTKSMDVKKANTTRPRGPRANYTKRSPTTLWWKRVCAQKYANNIQQFFPTAKRPVENTEECIGVKDEPDLEDIASTKGRVGSSESSGNA
ncbi:hypothetical protein OPQ81_001371 [Rhizoctonia solani]|nr:hypothetical protein OPQ81_001371 [Rhizoctonia solani]